MSCDELDLDRMGDRKTAAFFIVSDVDTTYNFIVALAFSQMFTLLCERAEYMRGSKLCWQVTFEDTECTRSALASEAISRLTSKEP